MQGYIFWPARKNLPPPSKILPCFCGFFAVFKLHKGILKCFYHSFLFFSSFPPFSFPFFKSSFKFFPVFHFGQKMARIYPYLTHVTCSALFLLFLISRLRALDPEIKAQMYYLLLVTVYICMIQSHSEGFDIFQMLDFSKSSTLDTKDVTSFKHRSIRPAILSIHVPLGRQLRVSVRVRASTSSLTPPASSWPSNPSWR